MRCRAPAAGAAAVLSLGACAETTIETSRTSAASVAVTTTTAFAPSGSALELLPELSTQLSQLSALVVDNEGDEQALARIEALWAAARDEVATQREDLVPDFERALALARNGVVRRRPADADKAFRNLTSLVDAYVGDG